jgi:hypothetical protein
MLSLCAMGMYDNKCFGLKKEVVSQQMARWQTKLIMVMDGTENTESSVSHHDSTVSRSRCSVTPLYNCPYSGRRRSDCRPPSLLSTMTTSSAADDSNLTISVLPDSWAGYQHSSDYANIDNDDKDLPQTWRFTDFGRVRERSRDGSSTYIVPLVHGIMMVIFLSWRIYSYI